MNQVHFQTVLTSKAARVVAAAGGQVVDFGMRRMHGADAAIKAARAFHIAGVAATRALKVPPYSSRTDANSIMYRLEAGRVTRAPAN